MRPTCILSFGETPIRAFDNAPNGITLPAARTEAVLMKPLLVELMLNRIRMRGKVIYKFKMINRAMTENHLVGPESIYIFQVKTTNLGVSTSEI